MSLFGSASDLDPESGPGSRQGEIGNQFRKKLRNFIFEWSDEHPLSGGKNTFMTAFDQIICPIITFFKIMSGSGSGLD